MSVELKQWLPLLAVAVFSLAVGVVLWRTGFGGGDLWSPAAVSAMPVHQATPLADATNSGGPVRVRQLSVDVEGLLEYGNAVEQYEGRRIQFDNCVAIPTSMTVKNGTKLMLDNRAGDGIEVTVSGVTHRIWGHEFKVVTFTSRTLPVTIQIDCLTQERPAYNAAQVYVQR